MSGITITRWQRVRNAIIACVAVGPGLLVGAESAWTPASADPAGDIKEVGQVKLERGDLNALQDSDIATSGWLVLNPTSRYGYQIFENASGTVVQSFDLDTLVPIRRQSLNGLPVTAGVGDARGFNGTGWSGDVVHAVDEARGIVYLALGQSFTTPSGILSPDARRQVTRYVAIDEKAFNGGAPRFLKAFAPPASQLRLHAHFALGLKAVRHVVPGSKDRGMSKLLGVFASPSPPGNAPLTGTPLALPYDHELVQWDLRDLDARPLSTDAEAGTPAPLGELGSSTVTLKSCATAPMATPGGTGSYQWGVLATDHGVYVACQSAPGAGAVVRIDLEATVGTNDRQPTGAEVVFPLSQQISDVLVDDGEQRLLVRGWINNSSAAGHTWWAFDARKGRERFSGSIAALQYTGFVMAAGLDPTTGRLYSLIPDHFTRDPKGAAVPVRGGFQIGDTRLDPVPPLSNLRPDLAYNGVYAIRVDPKTKRVFLRRGATAFPDMASYPGTDTTRQVPTEPFYRVLEDRVPVPEQPADIEDGAFTTDVVESLERTTASFLGSGGGYGTRVVLTGGTRALTGGSTLGSDCSKDDRELLMGSVGSVSVSDLSIAADVAAMDADARTQEAFGNPANRCRPKAGSAEVDACRDALDTDELAFDEPIQPRVDGNDDGCADRTRVNRYAASCIGDGEKSSDEVTRKVSRSGFVASVECISKDEKATGDSTGQMRAQDLFAPLGSVPVLNISAGYSYSEVSVDRTLGQGIVVDVDSISRNVEIPGVGSIGVIRAQGKSTATGRRKGADGDFTRTFCGVQLPALTISGCTSDPGLQQQIVNALNRGLGSRGRARLRLPDDVLLEGSPSGYRAGVQRESDDLFADRVIERDASLAVPALEITLFTGDGGDIGTARQIFHFAGVQAATTYGIACLYGSSDSGCAGPSNVNSTPTDDGNISGEGSTITVSGDGQRIEGSSAGSGRRESLLTRLLKAPFRMLEDVMRLLFNNPRELGLMAAVWALLFAPCYLGERRRSVAGLRARRALPRGAA